MTKVLTVGVFDLFHLGHLRLLKRASELGDHLIVAAQTSEYVKKYKPDSEVLYSTQQRIEVIESIKYVTQAMSYTTVDLLVKEVDYDILAVGPDQTNDKFQKAIEYSKQNSKQVIVLDRTKDISSSELKSKIERIFW